LRDRCGLQSRGRTTQSLRRAKVPSRRAGGRHDSVRQVFLTSGCTCPPQISTIGERTRTVFGPSRSNWNWAVSDPHCGYYLLQVVNILRLRQLRQVTVEEVDRAADHWNTLRNQDQQYPAGQFGVKCFAQTARDFCASKESLHIRDCPSPSQDTWMASSRRCLSNAGSRKRPFAGGDTAPATSSNGTEGGIGDSGRFDSRISTRTSIATPLDLGAS